MLVYRTKNGEVYKSVSELIAPARNGMFDLIIGGDSTTATAIDSSKLYLANDTGNPFISGEVEVSKYNIYGEKLTSQKILYTQFNLDAVNGVTIFDFKNNTDVFCFKAVVLQDFAE